MHLLVTNKHILSSVDQIGEKQFVGIIKPQQLDGILDFSCQSFRCDLVVLQIQHSEGELSQIFSSGLENQIFSCWSIFS